MDIVAVNIAEGQALADNGEFVPITNWFDVDAEECAPDDALVCVAGPDSAGKWWTITLSAFGEVSRH